MQHPVIAGWLPLEMLDRHSNPLPQSLAGHVALAEQSNCSTKTELFSRFAMKAKEN
jgi:hypothetical protein